MVGLRRIQGSTKSFMDFYDDASGLVSVLLIYLHYMTYVPRRIVICFIKYSHIPCTLLFHPFHRHIHSDLEHMTRFFVYTADGWLTVSFITRLLYEVYWHLPHTTYYILSCAFLDCFMFNCFVSIGQNRRIIIVNLSFSPFLAVQNITTSNAPGHQWLYS